MLTIAADPRHLGARIGITAVLHSWGSALTHHPQIHMIVPGGGISLDGQRWISSRQAFLLSVRVLGKLFRRLFLTRLLELFDAGRLRFFGRLVGLRDRVASSATWHRPARRRGSSTPSRRSPPVPAARPARGFHRIRHYGLLASGNRRDNLARARELLAAPPPAPEPDEPSPVPDDHRPPCPCCGGRMLILETFERCAQPTRPTAICALTRTMLVVNPARHGRHSDS